MGKVITVVNSKGGVAKTTSILECAYHAGTSLGLKCLVIDSDPQCDATKMLTGKTHQPSMYELMTERIKDVREIIQPATNDWPNVAVIPSSSELSLVESYISAKLMERETILKKAIKPIVNLFDLILIDLPPTLTSLTVNALTASDSYLVPTDTGRFSENSIKKVKELADYLISQGHNKSLEFIGIFTTSFQKGNSLAIRKLLEDLKEEYNEKLLPFKINDTVKILEAQSKKIAVSSLDPENSASITYKNLTNFIYTGVMENG